MFKPNFATRIKTRMRAAPMACLLLTTLLLMTSLPAAALKMTSGFTGAWFDPDHSGQGFLVEVIDNGAGPEALVFFFTYDVSGNPLWVFGQSPITGRGSLVNLRRPILSAFDPDGEIGPPEFEDWGSLNLSFSGCNGGEARVEVLGSEGKSKLLGKIQVRSGTLRLRRLSSIVAKPCTGGVSDDFSPDEQPGGFTSFVRNDSLFGVVDYEARADRAELVVDLKRAPPGRYDITIGGLARGTITVDEDGVSSPLKFSSPAHGNTLLDFDPVGLALGVSVAGDTQPVYSSELPDSISSLVDNGSPPPFGDATATARLLGATEDISFNNPSPSQKFEARASLVQRQDSVAFDVELTGTSPARYEILVDGKPRGDFKVDQIGEQDSYGQLRFRFPTEAGKTPLTFDPRGKTIEFRQAGGILTNSAGSLLFQLDLPVAGNRRSSFQPEGTVGASAGR